MDESITIIILSLAELSLVAIGLAIFFYLQSKKYKTEYLKASTSKKTHSHSDKTTVHGYFYEQVQKLQLLLKDNSGDTKTAIDARVKILQNESMLLSKDDIDYEQQLINYQNILASITTTTEKPAVEQNSKIETSGTEDTLFELDELEVTNTPNSEETPQTLDEDTATENKEDSTFEHPLEEEIVTAAEDKFELTDEEILETIAENEFDFSNGETSETVAEDEFEFADEETFETTAEDEFELADEETFETTAEDEFELADEEILETTAEDEFELADEEELVIVEEDEFAASIGDDSELVNQDGNEEFTEALFSEEEVYNEDIPILQDTIELDAPLITGELKNESAEIGKIRNIVSSLHGTIEELKLFSDEHELDSDAGEYLTTKLEEIEISNARLNLCTETLERDNARLLELVNQKEEEPPETDDTENKKNPIEALSDKDRKEKIELLEVELSSLEKRLDDKTNRLDNLQSKETGVSQEGGDDNTQIFDQLMREIDNLTELLTVKSEELSYLRVHVIDSVDEIEQQKETGT